MQRAREHIAELLEQADVAIGGDRPWDVQVHDERLFERVLREGSLGLGEAYMDGWWDAQQLDEFFVRILRADLERYVRGNTKLALQMLRARLLNPQRLKPYAIGEQHYDIGNDLYRVMLDRRLTYTCGYWHDAQTLDAAQEAKLDLICRKLGLQPGDRVLDIGSGWGSFLQYAAEHYGIEGLGVTVSKDQVSYTNATRGSLPIEARLMDYRDVNEQFDHIVSIGMFEHVGYKNYRAFMEKARELLADDGLFLLHTIGGNRSTVMTDPWIAQYIFPEGMLPSIAQIGSAIEDVFVMEDWHNFGAHYDPTLMAWYGNVRDGWSQLSDRYDERFYRMWTYYLRSCAGAFRARKNQLWQLVLSKNGIHGGYQRVTA